RTRRAFAPPATRRRHDRVTALLARCNATMPVLVILSRSRINQPKSASANPNLLHIVGLDAQPRVQPDPPVRAFFLAIAGASRPVDMASIVKRAREFLPSQHRRHEQAR